MPSTAITEQPVQQIKVIVGRVQLQREACEDIIIVENVESINEAREKLLKDYPAVLDVWIERRWQI